ncbi:YqjK-like family protein [Azonexus sp.]|uniref:YqjK-like family protein n=1 Tax=Azonexus sp. TaxID=1872668 RepID=UPI0027B8C494|nr:YqjK-like family protein [Azonexus sp.]
MNEKRLELAARRGALGARIASQRDALSYHAESLERLLAKGDATLRGIDWLKQHPLAVGASVAVAVILRPGRAIRWAKRGFFVWRGWQLVRTTLSRLR